jgi:hypothetical protein
MWGAARLQIGVTRVGMPAESLSIPRGHDDALTRFVLLPSADA